MGKQEEPLTKEQEERNRKFRILARAGLLPGQAPCEFFYRGVIFNRRSKATRPT